MLLLSRSPDSYNAYPSGPIGCLGHVTELSNVTWLRSSQLSMSVREGGRIARSVRNERKALVGQFYVLTPLIRQRMNLTR